MNVKILIIALVTVSGFIAFGLSIFSFRRRETNGALAFSAFMLCVSLYNLGYAAELSQTDLGGMLTFIFVEYTGLAFLPSFWLILALQYTGSVKRLTWKPLAALFIIPLITLVLIKTSGYHQLYYSSMGVAQNGPLVLFKRTVGPWYRVQFAYLNIMILAGNVLYLRMLLRSAPAFRKQAAIMLAGSLLPWASNFIYMAGLNPYGMDINVFALTLTIPFYTFAIFRSKMLDLVPVARGTVFENMNDPIMVLDTSNRMIDANNSARCLFPFLGPGAIGTEILNLVKGFPDLERQIQEGGREPVNLHIKDGNSERYFRSLITGFSDSKSRPLGRIVTLNDVTEQTALMQRLEELATIDDLTGVFNRRQIFELGLRELLKARRYGRPLSIMIMDIDHFKQFNDTYGHQAGDEVLVAAANACHDNLRITDVFGRYGGEEFVAILPDTDPDMAVTIAEKLRLALAGRSVSHCGQVLSVTASFGAAGVVPVTDETLDDLLKRADTALYRAKEGGRNRVERG